MKPSQKETFVCFSCDEDAENFVKMRASHGDQLALAALDFVG